MSVMMIIMVILFPALIIYLLYVYQEYIMFNPGWHFYPLPDNPGFEIEEVFFSREDGLKLCGWLVHPFKVDSVFTIMICHGTMGNLTKPFRISLLQALAELGMEIFIFDYSGIGRSEGRVSEKNAYEDALAAFNYLAIEKGIPRERVIVFGRSLGGAVASRLAAEMNPALLILESTFYSMSEEVRYLFPFVPPFMIDAIVGDRFPTYRFYRDVKCPLLVLHGTRDRLVPFRLGKKLYENFPHISGVFLPFEGGGHKFFLENRALYVDNIIQGLSLLSFDIHEKHV